MIVGSSIGTITEWARPICKVAGSRGQEHRVTKARSTPCQRARARKAEGGRPGSVDGGRSELKQRGHFRWRHSCVAGWKMELLLPSRSELWQRLMHAALHRYQSMARSSCGLCCVGMAARVIFWGTIVFFLKLEKAAQKRGLMAMEGGH